MSPFDPLLVSGEAQIADDVKIGYGTRIYSNVKIEDGCEIGDFCIIGHPLGKGPRNL